MESCVCRHPGPNRRLSSSPSNASGLPSRELPWAPGSFFSASSSFNARGTGLFFLMDNVFVPVHEGGHLLFRFLGTTIAVAGGTFLQLFVPFALAVYFAFQRQAQGVAFCRFFFFEHFLPAATYVADAC